MATAVSPKTQNTRPKMREENSVAIQLAPANLPHRGGVLTVMIEEGVDVALLDPEFELHVFSIGLDRYGLVAALPLSPTRVTAVRSSCD